MFETSEVISEAATMLCAYFEESDVDNNDAKSINKWLTHLPDILSTVLQRPINDSLFTIDESYIGSKVPEYAKLWEFITWAKAHPAKTHVPITQANKAEYRPLLQWIGGYCVENIDPIIWNSELIRRANQASVEGKKLCILGGIRFVAEAENVTKSGGVIVEVIRPHLQSQDVTDPTERQRNLIHPNTIVRNDGTMEDLVHKVQHLYRDICEDKLATVY